MDVQDGQDVQDGGGRASPCVSLRLPRPPYALRRGEFLNHDCRDGVMIAMIFPSLPLWILACAGMTCVHPPSPLTQSEGGRFLAVLRNDMV